MLFLFFFCALPQSVKSVSDRALHFTTLTQICYQRSICFSRLADLTCCILALGWLCDQREKSSGIDEKILKEAYELIRNLEDFYSTLIILRQDKSRTVAMKLLSGDALNEDEEQFMLTKLER